MGIEWFLFHTVRMGNCTKPFAEETRESFR
jgi:hypothetical protein